MSHAYRFFAETTDGGRARLCERDRRHLERVLRLRPGDLCEVVADGRVHRARVERGGLALLEPLEPRPAPPPVSVWLAQGGARADTAVEKLTELGVAAVGALLCERSKAGARGERGERWRRVAEAAAKQSGRAELPRIEPAAAFADVAGAGTIVLAQEGGAMAAALEGAGATILVGPEPGFSAAELELAAARGARLVSLGPLRLRSETAAVVAAALALHEMGFLR